MKSIKSPSSSAAESRRAFLARGQAWALAAGNALAAGCATHTTSINTQPAPLVGTQLYGWGQYYEREGRSLWPHLDEALSAVRDAGYDYAETTLDLDHPENNESYLDRCERKGLRGVSFYSGGTFHQVDEAARTVDRIAAAAASCRPRGVSVINCNPDPIGREKTDAELMVQLAALQRLGVRLNSLGIKLGIHHHTPEMRNRAREFHFNFENAAPEIVGFCYDVHWVFRGGLPPEQVLPLYGHRIVSWHLRQSRGGIWWEDMDRGEIDYAGVAAYTRRHRLTPYFTVELALEEGTKVTRTVVENHRRSRDFIRQTFHS